MSKLDETVPGGKYFNPQLGVFVDAHGVPLVKKAPKKVAPKPAAKKTTTKTAKKK